MGHAEGAARCGTALTCAFALPENRKVGGSTPPLATPETAGHIGCDLRFRRSYPVGLEERWRMW